MITTIIEKYLSGIDQSTFQKLMNHLLLLEGFKFIGSPGSVIGKNKTSKGTPDSYFGDGEFYAFCEYTTKEKLEKNQSFLNKLLGDIDHCFDVSKSKIEKNKINKIILAFTDELKPAEHQKLISKIQKHNEKAELIIYSVQNIPFKLVYYPGLADKYVAGVKTTSGTLYTLPDFLKISEKGLQPSLTNPFAGRENEIKQAKELLESTGILILSGGQGLGKSKLAIHLAEIFEDELKYEPRIIASSPVPLWEDLQNFILPDNKYFILFDDANKALPNLDYLLQFIKQREGDDIKVVITVRDYVRNDINKFLYDIQYEEMVIHPLDEKKITEIINESLPQDISLDPLVLERIITISKGNCRLALMATSSILQKNDISILDNGITLYDQYFQKVKSELSLLDQSNNLQALGILSFFTVLDRQNTDEKGILENEFKINWNELWETFLELEKSELVDVFQNEAVKISDQVLSTYVFFKTFLDENNKGFNYTDWLKSFFGIHEKKARKSLIDVINSFGFNEIKERVAGFIAEYQKTIENDQNKLLRFFEVFWFFRELETLSFVRDKIDNLEIEDIELEDIQYSYEANNFIWPSDFHNLLINFWNHDTQYTGEAIKLGVQLMLKQPSQIPEILKHLKENLSFHRYDFRNGYSRQHLLIDILDTKTSNARELKITEQIFLSVAMSFLRWEYHQTEGKSGGQMVIYNFSLVKNSSLMDLRKKIINRIDTAFEANEKQVLDILSEYTRAGIKINPSVYEDEQHLIGQIINSKLDPSKYSHCKIVYDYVKFLEEHSIKLKYDWTPFSSSDSISIAKLFSSVFDHDMNFEEQEEKRREEIKTFITGCDVGFIENLLNQLDSIYIDNSRNQDTYWIESGLNVLFQVIAETSPDLYLKSIEQIMLGKFSFELNHGSIIFYPLRKELVQPKQLYRLINRYDYKQKQFWKHMFFEALQENHIDEFFLQEFFGFLYSIRERFYLSEVIKYEKFEKQYQLSKSLLPSISNNHAHVITLIVDLILAKSEKVEISIDRHCCHTCVKYFSQKPELLKRVFYLNKKRDPHYDLDGKEMAAVSSLDDNFLIEYLTNLSNDKDFIQFKFDRLNLGFIWELPNYESILDKSLEIIISKAPIFSDFEHQANVLFKNSKLNEEQMNKAYDYINHFIEQNHQKKQHVHIILNVVTYSFNDQVLRFLREFLLLNKDIEFMKHLWLEKNGAITGSRVPRIESHIKFTESVIEMIKSLPNPIDYAEHVKLFQEEVEWAKKDKKAEMKRDFIGWID